MAWAQLAGAAIGGASKVASAPLAPDQVSATSGAYGSGQDGSGWSVNFSGVQAATSAPGTGAGSIPGPSFAGIPWWVLVGGVGLIVWMRRQKK